MAFVVALLVVAAVSLVIIRIGAVALECTGVSRETARFQSLSAFFGVGFTTRESEQVLNQPTRRRIIRDLIIVGNIGTLSVLTAVVLNLVNADISTPDGKRKISIEIAAIFAGLFVLWFLSRSRAITRLIDRTVAYSLARTGAMRALDYEQLLRVRAGYTVAEITLEADDWLTGQTIGQAAMRSHGVNVLGVANCASGYNASPNGATHFEKGDTLIVYGSDSAIRWARQKKDLSGEPESDSAT